MAKYIDAEKLKAEIEKRYDNMLERAKLDSDNANYWNGKAEAYRAIYDHIDSLQQEQPKVDLEKEVTRFVSDDNILSRLVKYDDALLIASHFYKLGLNARKEE